MFSILTLLAICFCFVPSLSSCHEKATLALQYSMFWTNPHSHTRLGVRLVKLDRLGIHLIVKVPRPGDSEMTFSVFESSCHLLLPV